MRHANASCGVIAVDKDGNLGMAFNTVKAVWAKKKNSELRSGMRLSEYDTVCDL